MNYDFQSLLAWIFTVISIVLFIFGFYSIFHWKKDGVMLPKGIVMSTLFQALGAISLSSVVFIGNRDKGITILFLLCIFFIFLFFYMLFSLIGLSHYQRGRRRGQYQEAADFLKFLFPDKK